MNVRLTLDRQSVCPRELDKAVTFVESRSLEGERGDRESPACAVAGYLLSGGEQTTTDATPATVLAHPDHRDPRAGSPGPPAETGYQSSVVLYFHRELALVTDAGSSDVVSVEFLAEPLVEVRVPAPETQFFGLFSRRSHVVDASPGYATCCW